MKQSPSFLYHFFIGGTKVGIKGTKVGIKTLLLVKGSLFKTYFYFSSMILIKITDKRSVLHKILRKFTHNWKKEKQKVTYNLKNISNKIQEL